MKIGVIGDDFTGSSDIALMLAGPNGEGLRTVQYVGVPDRPAEAGVEAGVVALKSRSIPKADAVRQSLEALAWLRAQGAERFLFKTCSTFDSTPEGNIGPVAEALIDALENREPVLVCPAFPATGRTVYRSHLFVNDDPLNESGLESHPLNPMTDANIARWLARQASGSVGRVTLPTVERRGGAVRAALVRERDAGRQLIVCDAVRDKDLLALADAIYGAEPHFALAVCGSGLALGIPALLAEAQRDKRHAWEATTGPAIVLSGSCSNATRQQLRVHETAGHPVRRIDVDALIQGSSSTNELLDWAERHGDGLPVLATSDEPEAVRAVQKRHGRERAAEAVERMFGDLARTLVERGFRRFVCAGGETSGAIVTALGLDALEIGPEIDPGVPAVAARHGDARLGLALKSGNFGAPDFFVKAACMLGGGDRE